VGIEAYGIKIVEQLPILVTPNPHNYKYLKTKKEKLGHQLDAIFANLAMSLKIAVVVSRV
jgi:hypothetical protein